MILLINPSVNTKTQPKIFTDVIRASFPFSLGHLAGYLLNRGSFSLQIIDDQIFPLKDSNLEQLISEMDSPKIIGLTTLTATCARVYEIARKIKEIDSQTTVILGGVHASVLPEECLSHRGVDIVVRGEGEETFAEIVENISNERDFRHIKGISYRRNSQFMHNRDRPLIMDLDSLPPFPYYLFETKIDRYPGFFSVQTSRGCPYGCTFCSQRSVSGHSYRYVSTSRAIRDIEVLMEKYGAKLIRIMDDNIGVNKKRLIQLLDSIIDKGINKKVSFEAPMRGDHLDSEILDKLKESNFSLLTFGLETASDSLMRLINKGETVGEVVNAIKMTAEKGISVGSTLIFGLPTETNQDRWDAIKLVSSLPLSSVRFNILAPYPGTPIYEKLKKEDKILIKGDWENFSVQFMWVGDDLPYIPNGTDKYELMFFTMLANLWFYIKPSGIIKLLTKSVAGGNVIFLQKKWYLSKFLFKILRVGCYLITRFITIFIKIVFRKIMFKKEG